MITTLGILAIGLFAIAPAAEASNYYYPSLGYQYQTTYVPTYTYTPSTSYSAVMTNDQLAAYLRTLIAQLQAQLSSNHNYGYNGYGYNYVIGNPRSSDDDDDDWDNEDEPEVETRSASDINDDDAELRGYVDMNDFEDGEVFFVYGTDEDQIEDVEDDFDSYSDVDTDGENLRKVRVDSSLDDSDSYETRVTGLDDDTEYYFSICVGYEDEDNDDALACGEVEDFETEN